MPKNSDKCCFCKINTNKEKNRRSVQVMWLHDFLKANYTDPVIFKWIHFNCYKLLLSRKNNGTLYNVFLPKGRAQHSTLEANQSRLVTKIR